MPGTPLANAYKRVGIAISENYVAQVELGGQQVELHLQDTAYVSPDCFLTFLIYLSGHEECEVSVTFPGINSSLLCIESSQYNLAGITTLTLFSSRFPSTTWIL